MCGCKCTRLLVLQLSYFMCQFTLRQDTSYADKTTTYMRMRTHMPQYKNDLIQYVLRISAINIKDAVKERKSIEGILFHLVVRRPVHQLCWNDTQMTDTQVLIIYNT